jgi:hypothetical protein
MHKVIDGKYKVKAQELLSAAPKMQKGKEATLRAFSADNCKQAQQDYFGLITGGFCATLGSPSNPCAAGACAPPFPACPCNEGLYVCTSLL